MVGTWISVHRSFKTTSVKHFVVSCTTESLICFQPVLSLMDFDECMLMPILNKSLAEKPVGIRIFASG
jgi:hypothetical protein